MVKLRSLYEFVIETGKKKDPRGNDIIQKALKTEQKKFDKLTDDEKSGFDKERLSNPYADSRILNGKEDTEVKSVLLGVDVETPELLLMDSLRKSGKKIDLAIAHHPEGRAYANFYEVMNMQADILHKFGVPINIAEAIMEPRIKEVSRKVMPQNHTRASDAARLLEKEDGYPIKTYVDFGLDETGPDEEQKVNPLVSFLEFLGSLKEGEQAWFQIIIKGADKKWVDDGNKLVGELMGRNKSEEDQKSNKLSKGEQEVVSAIEKNISKAGFETGIRAVYVARKDVFNPVNKASILGSMNHYNTYNLNGFKPSVGISPKPLGFLFKKKREARNKIAMLEAYRERGYFYAPHSRDSFVFNTEELATLFHFPGRVAEVPTFARIESRKSEPPPTLPI